MYKFAYRQSPRLQTRGFTLLDILLSISILALVLGLGVPSLTEILNTHKKKTKPVLDSSYDELCTTNSDRYTREHYLMPQHRSHKLQSRLEKPRHRFSR
jgi:Tfp pilus assembly protein FimT